MANEAQVIREFLVSLGFKVDKTSEGKFNASLLATTKTALITGKAIVGIGAAAQAMVLQFSSSMEKLYYASRRSGAAVENIQSVEFGFRKIGIASGVATQSLEAMAAAVRQNPGLRGLMDSILGKNTANMDQADAMLELVQKLSTLPHYQGAQFASMFGLDEQTFLMLKDGMPALLKAAEDRREMNRQAGIDAQAAAEAGREYANSIRDITERIGVLKDRLALELLPSFREFNAVVIEGLDNLAKFKLSDHPTMEKAVETGKSLKDYFVDYLKNGPVAFGKAAINGSGAGMKEALANIFGGGPAVTLGKKAFDAVNDWRDSHRPGGWRSSVPAQGLPTDALPRNRISPEQRALMEQEAARAESPLGGNPRLPLGLRQNNPGNLRSWGDVERRNGFASFGNMQEGLSAMAGNLLSYYRNRGLDTVQGIVGRYAPPSENDTGGYVAAIAKRLGVKAGDKLDLNDPKILSQLMGAMITQEQGYNPFGTADLMAAARGRIGGAPQGGRVEINQRTEINVNGAGDPSAVAFRVGRVQDEVTGNMVRNMRSAVQ